MNLLSAKILVFFGTIGSFPNAFPKQTERMSSSLEICKDIPSDPDPPDLQNFILDEVLSDGIFHINMKIRLGGTELQEATFVFGNNGFEKTVITQLLLGDLEALQVGLLKQRIPVIIRKTTYDNTPDDINEVISSRIVLSLIPDYYETQLENYGNVTLWDCPGFGYNEGSIADVAQMYFLKYALEITEQAKFIFSIKYSSLVVLEDLRQLATFASTLIKNIEEFHSSIGLIVTEIEDNSELSDEAILLSIRNHLELFIEVENQIILDKKLNGTALSEIKPIVDRVQFVKGLLKEVDEEENMVKVFFIKSPNTTCGSISNSSVVLDTLEKLRELQFSVLEHSTVLAEDVGFTLKENTLIEIERILEDGKSINEVQYAMDTGVQILTLVNKSLHENRNGHPILELINGFQDSFDRNFGKIIDWRRVSRPPKLGVSNSIIIDMDFFITCSSQRIKTIQFFEEVMGKSPVSSWVKPLQIFDTRLMDLKTFYYFCNYTHYALENIVYQPTLENYEGKHSVNNNTVLNYLTEANLTIPNQIKTIWETVGHKEQEYLVHMVHRYIYDIECVFEQQNSRHCGRATFYGKNVFLSEVIAWYKTWMHYYLCCHQDNRGIYDVRRTASVVAEERFYVDTSFDGSHVDAAVPYLYYLSVVAPTWEVTNMTEGLTFIKLNSIDRGGSGGGFFGVYSEIINHQNLFIAANGAHAYPGTSAGDSGTVHLINTSTYVNVTMEFLPGNGYHYWPYEYPPGKIITDIYKPLHGILAYNKKFIDNLILNCDSPQLSQDFFWRLRYMSEFDHVYTPLFYITELERLQWKSLQWKEPNDIPKCPGQNNNVMSNYYEKLLQVLSNRLKIKTNNTLAFTMIGSLIASTQISQKRLEKTLNIISTENYLIALEDDLTEIEKLQVEAAIYKETEEFKNSLNDKVKEAEQLVADKVKPVIKRAETSLKEMNKLLLKTLDAFLKAAEDYQKKVEDMKKQYTALLPFKFYMSYLNLAGTIVALLVPGPGTAAGAGLTTFSSMGNALLDGQVSLEPLVSYSKIVADTTEEYYNDKLKNPNEEVKNSAVTVAKGVTLGLEGAQGVLTFVDDLMKDYSRLGELEKAVQEADKQVNDIKVMRDQFHDKFAPIMDGLGAQITNESSRLNGTSRSGLTVKKFELKSKLKEMRKFVHNFVGPLAEAQENAKKNGQDVPGEQGLYENFMGSIETLEEALIVLFEMYNHIETYQERKELAQFISNVNHPLSDIKKLPGGKLRDALVRFELAIRINVLHMEYQKAEHAFKQFVFPFAVDYLMKQNNQFDFTVNSSVFADVCKGKIRNFRSIIQKYNAITTVHDQFVHFENFSSKSVSTRPFFVWKNQKWNATIRKLFQGDTIQLKSDCNMSGHPNEEFFANKAAIKFKSISLYIKAHETSRQEELSDVLRNFQMSITHSGMSLYLVNREQFVMRDIKQTFSYNFESHTSQNVVRYKVSSPKSDFLLSPYTWWTLKMSDVNGNGFEGLKNFTEEVDLELEGYGSYLDENKAGPKFLGELFLSDYYESYEPGINSKFHHIEPLIRQCKKSQMPEIRRLLSTTSPHPTNEYETTEDTSSSVETQGVLEGVKYFNESDENAWKQRIYDPTDTPKSHFYEWSVEHQETKNNEPASQEEEESHAAFGTDKEVPTFKQEPQTKTQQEGEAQNNEKDLE